MTVLRQVKMVMVIRKCSCCGKDFATGVFGFRCDYCQDGFAWTSHGRIGKAHPPCRRTPLALDGGDSAARQAVSTPEVVTGSEADLTPPAAQ